jgi:hypothetical protein
MGGGQSKQPPPPARPLTDAEAQRWAPSGVAGAADPEDHGRARPGASHSSSSQSLAQVRAGDEGQRTSDLPKQTKLVSREKLKFDRNRTVGRQTASDRAYRAKELAAAQALRKKGEIAAIDTEIAKKIQLLQALQRDVEGQACARLVSTEDGTTVEKTSRRMTGYMDAGDVKRLKHNLIDFGRSPAGKGLCSSDAQIMAMSPAQLLNLEAKALEISGHGGAEYRRKTHDALGLLCMGLGVGREKERKIFQCLHAQDKLEFATATSYNTFFNLDMSVFEGELGSSNSKEQLQSLKVLLFDKAELYDYDKKEPKAFVTLFSSPLSAVNLSEVGRLKAAVPSTAAFFSFCYPCAVNTLEARAKMAQDIQRGRRAHGDAIDLKEVVMLWRGGAAGVDLLKTTTPLSIWCCVWCCPNY